MIMYVNTLAFFLLQAVGMSVFYSILTTKEKFGKYFLTIFAKLLIVNILLEIVGMDYFGGNDFFELFVKFVNIINPFFVFAIIFFISGVSVEYFSVIAIMCEMLTLLVDFIPMLLCSAALGYDPMLHLFGKPTLYHAGCFTISALVLLFLYHRGNFYNDIIEGIAKKIPIIPKLVFAAYLFINIYFVVESSLDRYLREKWAYIALSMMLFIVIGFIIVLERSAVKKKREKDENLKLQQTLMKEYYRSIQEQQDATAKFRHDLSNHMNTIRLLVDKMDSSEGTIADTTDQAVIHQYVDSLEKQYAGLKRTGYCKNVIIDTVLANKVKTCKEENIDVSISFQEFELGKVEEIDMLTLIFNVFDNAIEACKTIEEIEKRKIRIEAYTKAGQIFIVVRNSVNKANVKYRNGKYLTTKKDAKQHGHGMDILRNVLQKYQGDLKTEIEKDKQTETEYFIVKMNLEMA